MLTGEEEPENAARKLITDSDVEIVVLKKGSEGASVFTHDTTIDVPVFPVNEVDPTGAGDAFDAGFLCGLTEGLDLMECARLAAWAGAQNAAMFGPMEGVVSRDSRPRTHDTNGGAE